MKAIIPIMVVLALVAGVTALSMEEQLQECANILQPLIDDPAIEYESILTEYRTCRENVYEPEEPTMETFGSIGEFYSTVRAFDGTVGEFTNAMKYSCENAINLDTGQRTYGRLYGSTFSCNMYTTYQRVMSDGTTRLGIRSFVLWRIYELGSSLNEFDVSMYQTSRYLYYNYYWLGQTDIEFPIAS